MRDVRVIQIGTPEDIVMSPIDDCVSDFFAGISRLKVVRAHVVMQPLDQYETTNGALAHETQTFPEDANLGVLIQAAIDTDNPAEIL